MCFVGGPTFFYPNSLRGIQNIFGQGVKFNVIYFLVCVQQNNFGRGPKNFLGGIGVEGGREGGKANERPKKSAPYGADRHPDRHPDILTDGNGNSMTELAQCGRFSEYYLLGPIVFIFTAVCNCDDE